ncbi:unnamed protein product [Oreochromis niloticus]|nr:unnamed protein product [Mustela putorius furo]
MSFACDKLYNGYIRRNMAIIVSKVKPREIMMHLPCLTAHDRDVIEAKTETSGHYNGMMLLLDCLKRRENWPEQFIEALEACEQRTIAADIRAEYNALTDVNNSNPSSSPASVVTAHVHPAPSAGHLPIPESDDNSRDALAPPAVAPAAPSAPPAPPEPAIQAPPSPKIPTPPQTPQSAADPGPKVVSPPEPVPEPPKSTQIEVAHPPSTPPASPKTTHIQVTSTEGDINFRKEPEENSESDIQNIAADAGAHMGSGDGAISVNRETTPPPPHPVEQHEADPLKSTTTKKNKEPENPPEAQINSDVTDGPSFYTRTPEKPPVQDSTPRLNKKPDAVSQPEEISGPPSTQIVKTAAEASPRPGTPVMEAFLNDDVCLSKPGQLVSIQPQNQPSPTILASSSEPQPYSGNTERLEISEAPPDDVSSVESTVTKVTPLPCQETGFANLNHNEPEENQYESPCQSFETQELVIHASGEPSIPNLDINGETAKEISSAPPSFTHADSGSLNATFKAGEEPAGTSAPWTTLSQSPNAKYILAAAGVGACAMLMAWRFNK